MSKVLVEKFDEMWERNLKLVERSGSSSCYDVKRSKLVARKFAEEFELNENYKIDVIECPVGLIYSKDKGEVFAHTVIVNSHMIRVDEYPDADRDVLRICDHVKSIVEFKREQHETKDSITHCVFYQLPLLEIQRGQKEDFYIWWFRFTVINI